MAVTMALHTLVRKRELKFRGQDNAKAALVRTLQTKKQVEAMSKRHVEKHL